MAGFTHEMQDRINGILSDISFESRSLDGHAQPGVAHAGDSPRGGRAHRVDDGHRARAGDVELPGERRVDVAAGAADRHRPRHEELGGQPIRRIPAASRRTGASSASGCATDGYDVRSPPGRRRGPQAVSTGMENAGWRCRARLWAQRPKEWEARLRALEQQQAATEGGDGAADAHSGPVRRGPARREHLRPRNGTAPRLRAGHRDRQPSAKEAGAGRQQRFLRRPLRRADDVVRTYS